MKSIYGPVPSWRLGRSLGVDPICSNKKICSFDCVYCQLGKTIEKTMERKEYVDTGKVIKELDETEKNNVDVITFSGTGEPTLNSGIGKMIAHAKKFGFPVAVLTNSSFLGVPSVRDDLKEADILCAKLDAHNEEIFQKINNPVKGLSFKNVLNGIKEFKKEFKGKLALQMMFIEYNIDYAKEMAELAAELKPDEVQLDTPLRKSAVRPLNEKEMEKIGKRFSGMNYISVYEKKKPKVKPMDAEETFKRRPEVCSWE